MSVSAAIPATPHIVVERPLSAGARALVAALDAHLRPLSPTEFQFGLDIEAMEDAATTVFVARNEQGEAIGIGALAITDAQAGEGEVKRMYTAPGLRGGGIARAILARIEAAARTNGLSWLRLETGGVDAFAPAWRLYEAAGFQPCGAFAGYPTSPWSRFYEKKL